MEEFDRHIKSKIDSLDEVPGVTFDEKRVWKKIGSNWGRNMTLLTVAMVLLTSVVTVNGLYKEEQNEQVVSSISREIKSDLSVDSTGVVISEEALPKENFSNKETYTIPKVKEHVAKASKGGVHIPPRLLSTDSVQQVEEMKEVEETEEVQEVEVVNNDSDQSIRSDETYRSLPQEEKEPVVNRAPGTVNKDRKELVFTSDGENQTVGITQLERLDNRFSLSYGIQINRARYRRLNLTEGQNKPVEFYQIEIPVGLRYSLHPKNGLLKPFLYTGLKSSFFLNPNSNNRNYNLSLESELGLDIRIFTTKNGKKGYLRFKYPLYNKNIINQGIQRPSLYDVLKR